MFSKKGVFFPGQGAQYAGMGKDFYEKFSVARAVFDQAADVLGNDFLDTIFSGPEEKLQQTENTQPAILAVSVSIFRVLENRGLSAAAMAGLSLGEYSALVSAGALSFEEALPLVQKRGIYMQKAVPTGAGKMIAIMGLDHEKVEEICREAEKLGIVAPANYNCPGQIVITGQTGAVEHARKLAGEAGAKKCSELKVSAPFHCSLLQPAEEKMAEELEKVAIKKPSVPIVCNVSACFTDDPGQIKQNLIKQVSNPIMWEQSVRNMITEGIDEFLGVGPGNSPARMMKRIAPDKQTIAVEKAEDVEELAWS
ncbi:MAG: ACP S-malonyltransferase [Bacillota bacterium]